MPSIESIILEVPDPAAAEHFYAAAFGLGKRLGVRPGDAPTSGFRGFTVSLVVAQPSIVDSLVGTAVHAAAVVLKPAKKGLWGYGGVVQAPDGAIWKIATSAKKNTRSSTRHVDDVVLLLGVDDVKASKQFYVDRGLAVAKSFGGRYVEFDAADSPVKLALYSRRAAAKDAGVPADGTGAHRIVIVGAGGPFTDPDGFAWEATSRTGIDSVRAR
jgi:catechol 2,3-dioxygenase-like lactoylglutathione lyase family enzyme